MLREVAPSGPVSGYDHSNLALYAELLDAETAGIGWKQGAASILGLDPDLDGETAKLCWITHLARARWIIGDGLEAAITAFGKG